MKQIASGMAAFNPDPTWKPISELSTRNKAGSRGFMCSARGDNRPRAEHFGYSISPFFSLKWRASSGFDWKLGVFGADPIEDWGHCMGMKVSLAAADGFILNAYRADPSGSVRGGVVVIQEIFGVNHHIRSVCDRLAAAGYRAMAPQVFDRLQPDFESGYSEAEVAKAREFVTRVDWAKMMLDASAAVDTLKREGPVAIIGFCMGGTVAFMAATRLGGLAASIDYYGGQTVRFADTKPRCPVQMHFGEKDTHIPLDDVETIRIKRPESEIHIYRGAGHGFHCDERASYEPNSAKLAWRRSLEFLAKGFAAAKQKPNPVSAIASPAPKKRKMKKTKLKKTKRQPRKKSRPKKKRSKPKKKTRTRRQR